MKNHEKTKKRTIKNTERKKLKQKKQKFPTSYLTAGGSAC